MDYERWLLEDALDFEFDGRGYRFEPEFWFKEELREMEARATEAPEAPAEAGLWEVQADADGSQNSGPSYLRLQLVRQVALEPG
ncbi:unnamed protein product [Boreogadus saida]